MSNPYTSPDPSDPAAQPQGWSSQQPMPPSGQYDGTPSPQQPYAQQPGAYGQQPGTSQPGTYAQPQAAYGQPPVSPQPGAYGQQQAWGQQGAYTQYPANYADVERLRSNSTIVLVLGILGIIQILPVIGSIVSWVWGNSLIRQGQEMGVTDDVTQNAKIGKVLGIISIVLWAVGILFIVALAIFGIVVANSSGS